jgi:hypothetical protein
MHHRPPFLTGLAGLTGLIAALIAATGCASAPPATDPYRFAWPPTSRVRITERVSSDVREGVAAHTLELVYVAELAPDPEGARLRLLEGRVTRDGRPFAELDPVPQGLALGRSAYRLADLTDVVIAPDGRALRCVESPRILALALAMTTAFPDKGPRRALELQVREAHSTALAAARCIDRWSAWVGAWVDFEARPGTPDVWTSGEVEVGEEAPIRVRDTHEGSARGGLAHLHRIQEVDPSAIPDAEARIAELARALSVELGAEVSPSRLALLGLVHEGTVDLAPQTLLPAAARWTETLTYTRDGMEQTRRTERRWTLRLE